MPTEASQSNANLANDDEITAGHDPSLWERRAHAFGHILLQALASRFATSTKAQPSRTRGITQP